MDNLTNLGVFKTQTGGVERYHLFLIDMNQVIDSREALSSIQSRIEALVASFIGKQDITVSFTKFPGTHDIAIPKSVKTVDDIEFALMLSTDEQERVRDFVRNLVREREEFLNMVSSRRNEVPA